MINNDTKKILKENIFETYKRILCKECKNRKTDLCEIRRCINGDVKCTYYER